MTDPYAARLDRYLADHDAEVARHERELRRLEAAYRADIDAMSRRDMDAAIVQPARRVRVGRSARDEAVEVGP